jgi:integrase/recombinase XerC
MGQHDRGQPGPGPGAAVLHLTEGVKLLHPEEQVFQAMLDGWRNQQLARNLAFTTIATRERLVRRFRAYTGADPWQWMPVDLEEFSTELRAIKGASHSTLLAYQNALRLFMAYLTDPVYGWVEECWRRFGTHPMQICTEWNAARHVQELTGRPTKRALTRDELQDLFDHADERVDQIRAAGRKGWLAAFRDATLVKVAYAWGLRRNEVRMLDLVDFGSNPHALEFGQYGVVYVRYGKAMAGSPPKRHSVLTVPCTEWVVDCLRQWIEEVRPGMAGEDNPAVWPSERSARITADAITAHFTMLRRGVGLADGVDFHSLRRSYITHLIEDGYDPLFAQQQAGYAHLSTTSIYTCVPSDYRIRTVREAMDRIAGKVTGRGGRGTGHGQGMGVGG